MEKSEHIDELAAALAKAQGMMQHASKDAANPFFKSSYATLGSVMDAIRVPFSSNGLSYTQPATTHDDLITVETMLLHSSGQWISSSLRAKPAKSDVQGIGSTISYLKRYGLQAMAGVASEDDDGEAAVGRPQPRTQPKQQPQQQPPQQQQQQQQAPAANKQPQIFDKDKPNMVQWMTSHLKENNITDSAIISSVISLMHGVEVSRKNIGEAVEEVMTQIQMRK
jgi:CHAT domain-containing protein